MNNTTRLIVHLIFATLTLFYFNQCRKLVERGGGSFWYIIWNQHVFLTNLTHTLVTIYYIYVLYQDIIRILGVSIEKKEHFNKYTYSPITHTYFQLVLSLSMIVGLGYWSLMIVDPQLLWGKIDPQTMNAYYMMSYLHGGNHLHLYIEIFLYKQHVFINKKQKFTIDFMILSAYFTITAIQYFVFGKVVYNFQNEGLAVMIPIYILSTLAFAAFDFGFLAISTKIGLYDVSIDKEQKEAIKNGEQNTAKSQKKNN
ncbi:FAR-17a/AIG1-like protein (macronuclear) [Tetrahymena thermophila SB210]|uniref:FAR-17a/AIG1-like protein n=1 Tax=Tetrahymena thermophila (strain SB210) TaxID=312017 RepID=Q233H2_TETTS|nr:FAR-17a/AIG1-like protein [Tetrahymena thermophila SB210]EAR91608.1 FAR-17a/AIG1-like protein [Tetrahymena thermophila SB210]|eukprot:XP_001011853.1 FAR-17a/AIG1-like protein [Tetrahymena thermophila SB210]